jgi:hypothetical protein
MQPRLFSSARLLTVPLFARCLAASLVSAAVALAPTAAHADTTTFSGEAYVARATLTPPLLPPITVGPIADTGPLPTQGGSLENSILSVNLPNPVDGSTLLSGDVGHTATIGQGDRSRSEASVADVNLNVAGNHIAADFLMARAMATCGPAVSGNSELANLVIDGQTITVSGQPNQTIPLPANAGNVVINEQSSTVGGNSGSIDVNALHVIVTGLADVVISHAHADISCPSPAVCTGGDFLTGGGWINTPSGSRANFAVAGGIKNGAYWGHLLYIDHGTGMKVKGTGVTMYTVGGTATTRHIEGSSDINGAAGAYKVDAADNGDPGRGVDSFAIALSNGYYASNLLAGGNIQLHQPCK